MTNTEPPEQMTETKQTARQLLSSRGYSVENGKMTKGFRVIHPEGTLLASGSKSAEWRSLAEARLYVETGHFAR
tara:strand:+ start:605 stop:826 length:222 start_codon:yes stop_codon:yes gene_type:complete